jgi:acyl-CoA synthetase (AMP-forming)/AMP-acid ligase II
MAQNTYPEYSTNYPLLLTTFMKRPVRLYPDETGVVYRNPRTARYFRFTWREWYARTSKLASALRALGVEPGSGDRLGDRVATMALNHHYHLETYYAASCSGAVLHAINMRLSLEHIVHTIQHAGDRVLLFDDAFRGMVEGIYDQIKDTVETFVYISDEPGLPSSKIQGLVHYEDLIRDQPDTFEWPFLDEDTKATACYTTGTTGLPKGVMFSHRALYLMILHQLALSTFTTDPEVPRLGENNVPLMVVPMFHAHGWGVPYSAVFAANKLVLPGMFTVDGFCELVEREKVTSTSFVPTVLAMLVEYPDLAKYDLSSLKSVGVGGAALSLGLKTKAEQVIPGFRASSGYGMTETAPTTVVAYLKKTMLDLPEEEKAKLQVKTGIPVPGLEVEVVDDAGKPVPEDDSTIGEIVIRGPWVMEEYWKDPERTAEVWRGGWFHTGDVARVDGEGYITIADRVKDMIRSGSEMVPTVLLENLLSSAEFVLEAAFVGVPDEKWGQRPMAIVTPAPGTKVTAEDVLDYLQREGVDQGKITRWMLPDYVLITDTIPKTSVGKFDKKVIRGNLDDLLARAKHVGRPGTSAAAGS